MGQGKSKPIRVVVNDNTVVANNLEQTNVDSDDVNNNKDTLGVATEEGNYPAAKPPPYSTKSKHSDNKQRPDKLAVVDETTSIDDDQLSKIKAMHVPVGASFQKMVRQKKEPDPLDVAYPETPHIIRSEPYSHDFGDPRWLSRPASKSLTLSRTELKAADTRIGRLHSSKKDIMFAERLRHEMRVVQSIVTRDTSIAPHKGQVRRFNFEAAMNLHNHFQNIEDTLAEEAAEKHKDHRAETYESLVDDLTGQFQTESLKVKTILAWISKQGIGNFQFTTVPPPDTPNGYMRLIQDDLGTYPVFFALLCRCTLFGFAKPYYRRKARGMILDAMKECDLPVLEKALDACERFDLPNTDPDVIGARMRHEFLSCKKELHVALLVNRIDVSEHALYATRNANLDVLFAKEIRKVEAHLKFLMQLDEGGWTVDIPDIDRQTLVELSQLRSPKIEIRLVLVAMYMLLGIDESYLRNWKNVQRLLRDQQSTLVEMARLEKYIEMDEDNCQPVIDVYTVERVNAIIGYYSEDQIRKVDNTLSVYFRWISGILQTTKDMYKERNIIIGDPDLESRVLSSILITPTSTPSKKLQQEQSQVPGTSKKNTNVPTEVPKKKIHTANRKQSSRLVASSSGKVLYRTHKESLNENEDLHNNVNRQSSAVSDDFFDEEDKASRKYLKTVNCIPNSYFYGFI
ncbi:hypothetical protein MAR_024519 [Mya arenaria]|uniref:Uncharacterized protein n=1 Tax=Mya arenaria TaxID=6604 RepID=A0ABY7DU87_MYAAR|nr:hypothetical protein MAR_024519 [Mya arenaria]